MNEPQAPYFAPFCRCGEHATRPHHQRFAELVGRTCDCPCHPGNEAAPWWREPAMDPEAYEKWLNQ